MKIGFFDSGLGGITVFNEALNQDINADFLYLADNINTPYGIKDKEEVKKYVFKNIEYLVNQGCDIVVIACNTATALCVNDLRNMYKDIEIIGIEPAVKVAANKDDNKKILITATTITLKGEKLKNLIEKLNIQNRVELLPLDKLVIFAENNYSNTIVKEYLKENLAKYNLKEYGYIVLGCTHFPIYKKIFEEVVPSNVKVIDGSKGIIKNLKTKINDPKLNQEKCNITLILTKEDNGFVKNFNRLSKKMANKIIYI